MESTTRVVHRRRDTITALPLYHSGYLLKRNTREKVFKRYYGELRGSTIFLYADDSEITYTEKLELGELRSMDLEEAGWSKKTRKTKNIFTLTLQRQGVQLRVEKDAKDSQEEWRGFIQTVVEEKLPAQLRLLPGQVVRMQDALAQEKKRKAPPITPPVPPNPYLIPKHRPDPCTPSHHAPCSTYSTVPSCFYDVTRQQAENMLERNPEWGSLILRPSSLHGSYVLSLRQVAASGPIIRHYRVTCAHVGFIIELESPVMVSSLDEVLSYCMEKTGNRLRPYLPAQAYSTHFEMTEAPKWSTCSSTASKQVPQAEVMPMLRQVEAAEREYELPEDEVGGKEGGRSVGQMDAEVGEEKKSGGASAK